MRGYRACMTRANYDPFDIQAEQQDAAEAAQREAFARVVQAEDFQWLMGHAQGRRFVWRMLQLSGMYRTSMTGNSQTFFNEGMRNFGIWLTSLAVELCVENYTLMFNENGKPAPQKDKTQ